MKMYENVQTINYDTNCADAQNIVNLHICTTKYYVSPHFKIVKIHKILCIAQITLYCTQNIVNLYNYTNCIVLYTNCKIYASYMPICKLHSKCKIFCTNNIASKQG